MHKKDFVSDLNHRSTEVLRQAMKNERSKKWRKVVENYRELLEMLKIKNFPPDYQPPDGYGMLLYEVYYHLGLAQQHLGGHLAAVQSYQKAIDAVFIPKNGCEAGCQSKSCLMTPLHTRRAFAYTKIGDLKNALLDAEKAVVLDARNPDAFCVRALVQNSFGNKKEAVRDLSKALTLNDNHMCALILRGCLVKHVQAHENVPEWSTAAPNKDHIKALSISPDCQIYLKTESFFDPNIINFFDRFLYSLNVPHNVVAINMKPDDVPGRQGNGNGADKSENSGRQRSFRCGTPTQLRTQAHARRMRYGESLRKHNARPKTAQQFLEILTKQEKDRQKAMMLAARPKTAMNTTSYGEPMGRSFSSHRPGRKSTTETSIVMVPQSPVPARSGYDAHAQQNQHSRAGRKLRTTCTETVIISQPINRQPKKDYGTMPVFQSISWDAPRVYYRPWVGDKLPVPDVPPKQFAPAFY